MKKTEWNLSIMTGLFVTSLLIANVIASKVVNLYGFILPAAVVAYPVTFLCTDVIGEIWGKEQANKTVKLGFIMQLIALGFITLGGLLPALIPEMQNSYMASLGSSWRFVLASLAAYTVSQFNDVYIFHKLKDMEPKMKWLRNNASTMTSQVLDTAIFITIAFWGIVPSILVMIASQYVVKVIIALLDTPFFYILTRESKRN